MTGEDAEILEAFLEESRENLDQLERDLVALEAAPTDAALLAGIFRTVHTVKGTCGFLGLTRLEGLSHAGENLLGALRAGDVALDAEITTALLALADRIRAVLAVIESTGTEGDDDHAAAIADLERLVAGSPAPAAVPDSTADLHTDASSVPHAARSENTVRVDVGVLDNLMELVGELVLARNQIAEIASDDDEGPLALPYRQLSVATGELQERVRQARLQPLGTVTGKFSRVVRDLAVTLDKRVRIEVEGEDVGVDKAVNEALADPLLHLVRNAVDHGLESPADRVAAGKPAEGAIRIHAFHRGGRVLIEVSDDGKGVDGARLVEKAVTAGILSADDAAAISGHDALELMFHPGLSTADHVTTVSGRGVGMDVVRSSLEQVGGSVDVSSEPGRGTLFRISVPLTLTIMPAVVVWCGGQRYAIPQIEVDEVLWLDDEQAAASINDVDGARIHRLRGRLLPLVDLAAELGLPVTGGREGLTIAVIDASGRRLGLIVDSISDTTEMVVKPLTKATRGIAVFAGVTILGDGVPSLVLDGAGLATRAGIVTTPADEAALAAVDASADDEPGLLLLTAPDGGRVAVELERVRRLELFPLSAVERVGTREVLQYGDGMLPLVRVGTAVEQLPVDPDFDTVPVAVCESAAGLVGLVVGSVEDIVSVPSSAPRADGRAGVVASLVLDERVTELLDVDALVSAAGLEIAS